MCMCVRIYSWCSLHECCSQYHLTCSDMYSLTHCIAIIMYLFVYNAPLSFSCACRYVRVDSYTQTCCFLSHTRMLFLISPPSAVMNYDMDVARSIAVFIGGIVVLTFIAERFHRGWRHHFVVLCCCCYVSGTCLCGYIFFVVDHANRGNDLCFEINYISVLYQKADILY